MSYITSERIPELGVRVVLGATGGSLVRLMLLDGFRLIGLGIGVGVLASIAGARFLSSLLFGVSPFDAPIYVVAAVTLASAGLIAVLVPALRVLRTDPTVALRAE